MARNGNGEFRHDRKPSGLAVRHTRMLVRRDARRPITTTFAEE
jgi:hypothetical protein